MKLFEQHNVKEGNPPKTGFYNTDKGRLFWFNEGQSWSESPDFVSKESPVFWYSEHVSEGKQTEFNWEETENEFLLFLQNHRERFGGLPTYTGIVNFFRHKLKHPETPPSKDKQEETAVKEENRKLKESIRNALNIKALWAYDGDRPLSEHQNEAEALLKMEQAFESLITN